MGQNRYSTGALKDVRKPDELVTFYVSRAVEVPRIIDHSQYNAWPFYQDGQPICVGVAFDQAVCNDAARLGIIPAGLPVYFSPTHIYNTARKVRGLVDNNGCYPEDAATAICETGLVPYTAWPCRYDKYGDIIFDPAEPDIYLTYVIKLPNTTKARIDNGIDGLLGALVDGVVSFAIPWFDEWASYTSGVLPPVDKLEMSARHNLIIDGANRDEGMLYGPNWHGVWGIKETPRGERPFPCGWKMPFEYIDIFKKKFGGYDAWNINFDAAAPLPPMKLSLAVHGQNGHYGSGLYDPGQKVEVYAGAVSGYNFSNWCPPTWCDNPWAAKTIVTMRDVIELHSVHKKQPTVKRCRLFDFAAKINEEEGIQ